MPWEFRGVADSGMYHFQARTLHTAVDHMSGDPSGRSYGIFVKKWGIHPVKLQKLIRRGEYF